jgi:hypothetical protein
MDLAVLSAVLCDPYSPAGNLAGFVVGLCFDEIIELTVGEVLADTVLRSIKRGSHHHPAPDPARFVHDLVAVGVP